MCYPIRMSAFSRFARLPVKPGARARDASQETANYVFNRNVTQIRRQRVFRF